MKNSCQLKLNSENNSKIEKLNIQVCDDVIVLGKQKRTNKHNVHSKTWQS